MLLDQLLLLSLMFRDLFLLFMETVKSTQLQFFCLKYESLML